MYLHFMHVCLVNKRKASKDRERATESSLSFPISPRPPTIKLHELCHPNTPTVPQLTVGQTITEANTGTDQSPGM